MKQQIERIIYRHKEMVAKHGQFWGAACACGWKPPYFNTDWSDAMVAYSRHVADVLVSELGLVEVSAT
jgi:hypothetical protein